MKEKNDNRQELSKEAINTLEVFCEKFAPAKDELDATHFYTSVEIQKALEQLTPEASATPAEIYAYLYPLGYRPTIDTSHAMLVYKWMLKCVVVREKFSNLDKK